MFRRLLSTCALTIFAATSVAAQMHHDDMDKSVKGGPLPTGWHGRTDDATSKIEEARFVVEGKGLHVSTGPAGIYWNGDKNLMKGPFIASVTMRQTKAPSHPEAYGLVFMGSDLDKKTQSYMYFLVRGDGKFLVNHRAGEEVHKIMPWTDNAAIVKADANGVSTNTLSVDATMPSTIILKVNGVEVHRLTGDKFGKSDGIVGLRVNHNLDVAVTNFTVSKK